MADTQYIAVRFRPQDGRSYTYHNDGEPVEVGDRVSVSTSRGEATVEVIEIIAEAPPFITKSIINAPAR